MQTIILSEAVFDRMQQDFGSPTAVIVGDDASMTARYDVKGKVAAWVATDLGITIDYDGITFVRRDNSEVEEF